MENNVMINQAETAARKTRCHPSCRQLQLEADQQIEPELEAYLSTDIAWSSAPFYATLITKILKKISILDFGPTFSFAIVGYLKLLILWNVIRHTKDMR